MNKEIKHFGYWFLPTNPTLKLSGNLTYSNGSPIELEIHGMFGDFMLGPDHIPIILGETNAGPITLVWNNFMRRSQNHSKYKVNLFFVNKHFNSVDEIKFKSFRVSFYGLESFLKTKGFNLEEREQENEWQIEYKQVEDIKFVVPNVFSAEITTYPVRRFEKENKITLDIKSFVQFDFYETVAFKEALLQAGRFRGFLSLCNNECCFFESITILADEDDSKVDEPIEPISLIIKDKFYQTDTKQWLNPILPFKDIGVNFNSTIAAWYQLYSEIEDVLNLRLFHFKDKYHFTIDRFLDMARALESYHRLRRNNFRFNQTEYKNFLKTIKSIDIEKKFKQLINDRLNYGNEPTFKSRLNELFCEMPSEVTEIINADNKLQKIIKDTRNYYTHYGEELKPKLPSLSELVNITTNLEAILSFLFFTDIGIDKDILKNNLLEKNLFRKWEHGT